MEAEFSTLWGAVTVSQSPNCVEGLLAAPGSATFFPLETPLSSCPHSRVAASDGLGPCCKWQQQSKSGHGYQEAEVVWKHYRIFIVHRGSVFVTKQRGHQLNIKKKKNLIHSLKCLTDGLPLPERATSKSKLKTHWLSQPRPLCLVYIPFAEKPKAAML